MKASDENIFIESFFNEKLFLLFSLKKLEIHMAGKEERDRTAVKIKIERYEHKACNRGKHTPWIFTTAMAKPKPKHYPNQIIKILLAQAAAAKDELAHEPPPKT